MAGLIALAALPGCATRMGPSTIPAARFDYTKKIARSQNDQLLLNLVRLRYRETPVVLDVGSVIAQYSLSESAGASPLIGQSDSSELGLSVGGSYSEQPTITYEPLKGADFTRRLLTPVSPMTILLLSELGWSIERLLMCCVESINGIENAPAASGPTPDRLPDNERFRELARLLRKLQIDRPVDLHMALDGDSNMARVRIKALGAAQPEVVRANLDRVRDLLGLEDENEIFNLKSRGLMRQPNEIAVAGRSLPGVLFFLANGVHAPADHETRGLVTVTRTSTTSGRCGTRSRATCCRCNPAPLSLMKSAFGSATAAIGSISRIRTCSQR